MREQSRRRIVRRGYSQSAICIAGKHVSIVSPMYDALSISDMDRGPRSVMVGVCFFGVDEEKKYEVQAFLLK